MRIHVNAYVHANYVSHMPFVSASVYAYVHVCVSVNVYAHVYMYMRI